jgi:hypothetical protein
MAVPYLEKLNPEQRRAVDGQEVRNSSIVDIATSSVVGVTR